MSSALQAHADARTRLVEALREHALVIGEVVLTSGAVAGYLVDAKRASEIAAAHRAELNEGKITFLKVLIDTGMLVIETGATPARRRRPAPCGRYSSRRKPSDSA